MTRCPYCAAEVSEKAETCPRCHQPVGDDSGPSGGRGFGACAVPVACGLTVGVLTATILVIGHMVLTNFEAIAMARSTPTSVPSVPAATRTPPHTPTPSPTSTPEPTPTPQPPTPTETPIPPTPTDTPVPPEPTPPPPPSPTPVPPTRTPRPTPTMACPTLIINVPSAAPAHGLFGIEWDSTAPPPDGWDYAMEFRPERCVPSWRCVWTRLPVPLGWWEEGGHLHAQVRGLGEEGVWYWRVCLVNTADPTGPSSCCGEPYAISH